MLGARRIAGLVRNRPSGASQRGLEREAPVGRDEVHATAPLAEAKPPLAARVDLEAVGTRTAPPGCPAGGGPRPGTRARPRRESHSERHTRSVSPAHVEAAEGVAAPARGRAARSPSPSQVPQQGLSQHARPQQARGPRRRDPLRRSPRARGASQALYFSGCRTCSVEAGGRVQAALTASHPPRWWTACDEVAAGEVGQHELVPHHRRGARHRRPGIEPSPKHARAVPAPAPSHATGQALQQEALHHEGRVTLEQAQERHAAGRRSPRHPRPGGRGSACTGPGGRAAARGRARAGSWA